MVQITEVSETMVEEPEAPLSFLVTEMLRSASLGVTYWSPSAQQSNSGNLTRSVERHVCVCEKCAAIAMAGQADRKR